MVDNLQLTGFLEHRIPSPSLEGWLALPKELALIRLLDYDLIEIVYLQETLGTTNQVISVMQSLKPGWNFHTLDVIGRSVGIGLGINPRTIKIS